MRLQAMAAVAGVLLVFPVAATADNIRVQSTTDTVDAGLVDDLLKPAFAAASPGDTLTYTAVGTGAALTNARNGLADVVITHAPSLENQFVQDGFAFNPASPSSLGIGKQIFYSDYVVVGTNNDLAGVKTKHPNDAVGAYEDIYAAGQANPGQVKWLSRNTNSGTDVAMDNIWHLTTGTTLAPSDDGPTDTSRQEPSTDGTRAHYPTWFRVTGAGQRANLDQTSQCAQATSCYTMVDRGTYNRAINAGADTNLTIVSQNNSANARGGVNLLVNPFSAYIVNPTKFSADPKPNTAAGARFVSFLTSQKFQDQVAAYPKASDPAFRPDAFPAVTITSTTPQGNFIGDPLTFTGTATNRLPGGSPPSGMTVQLQKTISGEPYANVGSPVTAGNDGKFSVTTTTTESATYRVVLSDAAASTYNGFTGTTVELGRVLGVPKPATVTPTPSVTVSPTPTPDRKAPTVSRVSLSRRGIKLTVSEGGTVKATIRMKAGKRYRTVAVVTFTATGRKALSARHRRLTKGTYRVVIVATDDAGNKRRITKTLKP